MIRKIGLDPSSPIEKHQAFKIFLESGLLDEETWSSWSQICLMAKSLSTSEFAACLARDPWRDMIPVEHYSYIDQPTESVSFHFGEDVRTYLKVLEDKGIDEYL